MNEFEERISRLEFYTKLLAASSKCMMTTFFINNNLSEQDFDEIHDIFEKVDKCISENDEPDRLLFETEIDNVLLGRGSIDNLVLSMGVSERWLNVCRWYRGY
jgi:hypothetical protein